ncbi:MAG: hypothetical protein ACREAB_15880 [Blastocatellia bacterium]
MRARMIIMGLVVLSLSARLPVYSAGKPLEPQTTQDSRIEDVKSQIWKIGVGEAVTISLTNGKKVRGFLTRIGDSDFELAGVTHDATFKYEEVARVDKGVDLGFKRIRVSDGQAIQTGPPLNSQADAVKLQITGLGGFDHRFGHGE